MEVDSALTGRRGVCLPFTDTCEPIAENAQEFQKLFDQAVVMGRKRKWKYLELRGGEKYLSAEKPSQSFWGHTLDLSCGQEQLFSNLRDSTRRNIKKAQNENINVTISTSPQSIKDFYRPEHNDTERTRTTAATIQIFSASVRSSDRQRYGVYRYCIPTRSRDRRKCLFKFWKGSHLQIRRFR